MINNEIKHKLLKELEKSGNVFFSCMKVNIDRSTYYRWYKQDKSFKKKADTSLHIGRENLIDIAEHALVLRLKEKDLGAIKYALSHNSPRYRTKREISRVIIEHISGDKNQPQQALTFEDLLYKQAEISYQKSIQKKDSLQEES